MPENSMVSCPIPLDWQAKIEVLATQRRKSPEEIVYEAIAHYLGENALTSDNRLSALEVEVSSLHGLVAELSSTVKDLQQGLVTAASSISVAETKTVNPTQVLQKVDPDLDEDIEDEPDEILYDFLPSTET